jgi:hypothetical protein
MVELANQLAGRQRLPGMNALHFPVLPRSDRMAGVAVRGSTTVVPALESPPAGSLPLAADCFISRLHLHDYVDGELDTDVPGSALREIIHAHLRHCARCARLEQQVRALRLRLREYAASTATDAEERVSPEFRARMTRLLAG